MSLQHVNGHYVVDQGAAAFLPASLRVLRNAGTDAGAPRGSRLGRMALHVLVLGCFGSCLVLSAAVQSPKVPVVAKWGRFEQSFTSGFAYSNALQEATLKVVFTSPLGQTNQVDGFWDGGKIWRVRFSPDQPGRWTFRTTCSDGSNTGLHNKTGELVCTAATGKSRFNRHGPVRIARDHRHFEHADGTAFFWVADTVWNGARGSETRDWEFYARTRAAQQFTVAQWSVAPGEDMTKQSAVGGVPGRIGVNPDVFKRLDAKLETLSRAGILSAIVPLLELESERESALPDEQAELLLRYIVARWGAEPAAWLLAFDGGDRSQKVERWKRIGQAVFDGAAHAPVILYGSEKGWLLDEFRDRSWVDAFGFRSITDLTDDASKPALTGPSAKEWTKEPAHPLILFATCENAVGLQSKTPFSNDDVRQAVYWGLLLAPPAGVSFTAKGVVNWEQASYLVKFMNSIEFWRLRPQPQIVAAQPGTTSPRRYIAAAGTDAKDLVLVYVPEDRTVEILLDALPPSPNVSWFNPRTGETSPAVAVVGGRTCQFPTPDPGDWLLVMKSGK